MKPALPLVLTTFAALLLAGCETDVSARIQEKPATYAALAPEQQQAIRTGALDIGYTSDMVYLSLGKPSKIETKKSKDGPVTVWTYTRFYPTEAVAETWSVSRYEPTKLQVLFFDDKVLDATLKQHLRLPADDMLAGNPMSDRRFEHIHTAGMAAAGIYPSGPAPVSTPPGVGK